MEPMTPPHAGKSKATKVAEIFLAYIKSMLFAFTGGSVTLPLLQQQLDHRYHLLDSETILEYFALGQAMPGVISLNAGILIGRKIAGWPGAFAAVAGCVLPGFFGMLLITASYTFLQAVPWITGLIGGIRAASIAVIFSNALLILREHNTPFGLLLAAVAFVCTFFLGWNILIVVVGCGLAGALRAAVASRRAKL